MGCFLACLGSSKNKKGKRLRSNRVPAGARDQRRGYNPVEQVVYPDESFKPVQRAASADEDVKPVPQIRCPNERELVSPSVPVSTLQNKAVEEFSARDNELGQEEASLKKGNLASPSSLGSRSREKSAEKSSSGAKKKVSFNSVVKTYEPVPTCDLLGGEDLSEDEKTAVVAKQNKSNSSSEAGSNVSSVGSYPPNHRYQNCRESDDEEELDYVESDIDIDNSELEEDEYSDGDAITDSVCSMESTNWVSPGGSISPEGHSHEKISERTDSNLITRGRDAYDQSVLNPVENLSQWKALKAMGKKPPPQKPQKENHALDLIEPPVTSFSHEPIFNQARTVKSIRDEPEHQTQHMAVDASLSNWLVSPEPLSKPKASAVAFDNVIHQQTTSQVSYLTRSFDDRPILGAMTVEELKLLTSRTSSPRKSPSKSPDDMAIIGSVGSYWSNEKYEKHSSRDSSCKGMPNTTSKYREVLDMRVNWDSTPFETRLENALNQDSAEA